jgi:hypothetical protein
VATCPAGLVVIGGGGAVGTSGGSVGALESSTPTAPNQWTAVGVVTIGKAGSQISVKAYAICGNA